MKAPQFEFGVVPKRRSLSLTELFIAIAIMAILAAFLVPRFEVQEDEGTQATEITMKSTVKRAAPLGAAALLTSMASGQAAPSFITTAQGRGADAPIRAGNWRNDNFGGMDIMRVRNSADLNGSRKTYLRFDLKTLPRAYKEASAVTLGLEMAKPEGHSPADKVWTFNVFGLKDGDPDENWGEKAVKWNSAPANDATDGGKLKDDVLMLGTFNITGTGTVGQKIGFSSPELDRFVRNDKDGQVTLIITRQEAGNDASDDVVHIFASKEYGTPAPPVLSVAFQGDKATLPTDQEWAKLPVGAKPWNFENEIDAFEAEDKINPPAKGQIEFTGSSSIRLWTTLAQDYPDLKVFNRGFGGSQVADSVHFADRIVTPYAPKMIVFYAGTNDIADGKSPETIFADWKAYVAKVRQKLPTVPIAYISISPSPSRFDKVANIKKANDLIQAFNEKEPNLKFIDIFPLMLTADGKPRPELFVADQLHMNPDGYAIWVKAVRPYLPKP